MQRLLPLLLAPSWLLFAGFSITACGGSTSRGDTEVTPGGTAGTPSGGSAAASAAAGSAGAAAPVAGGTGNTAGARPSGGTGGGGGSKDSGGTAGGGGPQGGSAGVSGKPQGGNAGASGKPHGGSAGRGGRPQGGAGAAGSAGAQPGGSAGESAGGAGSVSDACSLPWDPGSCDDTLRRFAFDAAAGRCTAVVYGGCEGNANRFESLQACAEACDRGGFDGCESNADCFVKPVGCCEAGCEPVSPNGLAAANRRYETEPTCPDLVMCEACEPYAGIPELPYYGTTCSEGRCKLYDVRETDWGTCDTSSDCWLRNGLDCCEGCSDSGTWVAVNRSGAAPAGRCAENAACVLCEPLPPEDLGVDCVEGRCVVVYTE